MKRTRSAVFTPLHRPHVGRCRIILSRSCFRPSKRPEGRAPESQRDSSLQPKVARHELPWVRCFILPQPQRGCITFAMERCNPVGVGADFDSCSQGSRSWPVRLGPPALGWMTLPRWGNQAAPRAPCVTAPGVPKNYPDPKKLVTEDYIRPAKGNA